MTQRNPHDPIVVYFYRIRRDTLHTLIASAGRNGVISYTCKEEGQTYDLHETSWAMTDARNFKNDGVLLPRVNYPGWQEDVVRYLAQWFNQKDELIYTIKGYQYGTSKENQ